MEYIYTIILSEKENKIFSEHTSIPMEWDSEKIFEKNSNIQYAYFHYYKKRTPEIHLVEEYTFTKNYNIPQDSLLIVGKNSVISVWFLNIFAHRNKTILYIENSNLIPDIEKTWNLIQNKRNLKEYKKLLFNYPHWSKLVYAYRGNKSYNLLIEDITY